LLPSSGAPLVTRAVAVVQYFEHPSRQWSTLVEALGGGASGAQAGGQAGAQTAGGQQGGGTHISVNIGGNASGLTIAGGNIISHRGSGD
jgi:hypothetical protein